MRKNEYRIFQNWEPEEYEDSFEFLQQSHQQQKEKQRLHRQHEFQKRQKAKQIVEDGQVRFGVTGWTAKGGTLIYQPGYSHPRQYTGAHVHYQCYGRGKYSKFLKKQGNKKSRRNLDLPNGNAYRKEMDYWREVF